MLGNQVRFKQKINVNLRESGEGGYNGQKNNCIILEMSPDYN